MRIVQLIGICSVFLSFHFVKPQGMCKTAWKVFTNSNFRNASSTKESNTTSCLNDCKNDPACLAVDIKAVPTIGNLTTCWFHTNPADLGTSFTFQGVDSHIKTTDCTGYTNIKSLWGQTGATGAKGPPGPSGPGGPGSRGSPGMPGYPGSMGSTGDTGYTGTNGAQGTTGFRGNMGDTGFSGVTGSTGFTGIPGGTGASGVLGPVLYVKEACDPTWVVLDGVKSPNAVSAAVGVASLNDCLNLCLSAPNCVAVEFTSSTTSCSVHTVSNNLNTKLPSSGTTQYFLKQRCYAQNQGTNSIMSGLWGNKEVVVAGATGATGLPGFQGLPGFLGSPGFPGFQGPVGPPGFPGMIGVYGWTGSTGNTGPTGMDGIAGARGSTGQPGDAVYVRESCQPKWVRIPDFGSPGASSAYFTPDSWTCQNLCLTIPKCVAVDYDPNSAAPCKVHVSIANLVKKFESAGVSQFVLISKCPFNASATLVNVRVKRSDSGGTDEPLVKVCKVPQKNPTPWYYALVMTPVMAFIVNCLCFLAYILVCKKFYSKGRSVQGDAEKSDHQVESNVYDNNTFNN